MTLSAGVEDAVAPSIADYTVACICPLGVECAAVEGMLDEIFDPLPTFTSQNAYTFGRLGKHHVVVAIMPELGNNAAATVATQLLNDFPSLRFGLLVGIGGGVPGDERSMEEGFGDVRLGDVVVSQATDGFGGVVQYDLGKSLGNGSFRRTGHLNKPPAVLSGNVRRLDSQHRRLGSQIGVYLEEMLRRYPQMRADYQHPGVEKDQLFKPEYAHKTGITCADCDLKQVVHRRPRPDTRPRIHYGTIGSANVVVKDATTRDLLRKDMGIFCVEMEAAGIMDSFPCLVVRGICDYADSHKNKRWQPYAAATAAAYMKELLTMVPPQQVKETEKAEELMQAALGTVLDALEEPVRNTAEQVDQIKTQQEENRRTEILRWISTTPYEKHYRAARANLMAGSGQWLLRMQEFAHWLESKESGLLWMCGKPGAGKTKTCAMIVERLSRGEEVLYFFCSRSLNGPDRQNPTTILRALVHQACTRSHHNKIPHIVCEAFDKRHSSGMGEEGLDFSECQEMLATLLAKDSRAVIIIDALDECSIEDRSALLEFLNKLVSSSASLVRVFISSRGDRDIAVRLKQWPKVVIEDALVRRDMERFIENEITQAVQKQNLLYGEVSPELQDRIAAELVAKAGGMFLWVRLQLQLLCHMQTEYQVLDSLGRLPPTLSATYDRIYERIVRSPSTYEAHKALAWLICARQPLRPSQWAAAVSWTIHRKREPNKKQAIQLSPETLLGMCQSLVVYDEMQDHITYSHVSVREYLEGNPRFATQQLENMAAGTCLRFLLDTRLPRPSQPGYSFYRYCARYWIDHTKACREAVPPELDSFLGTAEGPTSAYLEWKGAVELFGRRYREYDYADGIGTLVNGLLLAAYHGIQHTALWETARHNPNATDECGLSLLTLASQNGQVDIVRLLLGYGAVVNPTRTPLDTMSAMCVYEPRRSYNTSFKRRVDESHCLFLAIKGGHPEVVMLLLEAEADLNGLSALMAAAGYGPPSVFSRVLGQQPRTELTEQALIMAAMNMKYPETLKAVLSECPDASITGHVAQAVLENREDGKEIFKRFFTGRVTAHILVGIWRRERRHVLGKLLDCLPGLPVSANTIKDLAWDALPGEDCVIEVLQALLLGNSIKAATLKSIFRIGDGAFSMLCALLKSKSYRTGKGVRAEQQEHPQILFEQNVTCTLSEDVALAAVQNQFDALKLSKVLFSQRQAPPITEAIAAAAASYEDFNADLLKFMFSLGRGIPITASVVAAAARSELDGLEKVELLLSKAPDLQLTQSVIESAASNSSCGPMILQRLLSHENGLPQPMPKDASTVRDTDATGSKILEALAKSRASIFSEAALVGAAGSGKASINILEIFFTHDPSLPVTEAVLIAAAKNTEKGSDTMKLLLKKSSSAMITEAVIVAAVQNNLQDLRLLPPLLERADTITISEKLVFAVSTKSFKGDEIMNIVFKSGKVRVEISAVRAAAVMAKAAWFDALLSLVDKQAIDREYGQLFLAAVEGGDPHIFHACLETWGFWGGIDKHGWSAELMASYRGYTQIYFMLRQCLGPVKAIPIEVNAWEVQNLSSLESDGLILEIQGDNDTHQKIRGNHAFFPNGTSYFEVEVLELVAPKKQNQGIRDALAIGVIDEFLQYSPAYYSNNGYVSDLFLTWQARPFRAGDVVGYGIDWQDRRQFVTLNGERENCNMSVDQLYERRIFPYVCLYAGAGNCKVKANFRGPFLYHVSV